MARRPRDLRARRSFGRAAPSRTAKETVLIVCEGEKTEPSYLDAMIRDLGLTSADVRVCGKECGSDPDSVAKHAIKENKSIKPPYDRVICVVDTDSHNTLDAATNRIRDASRKGTKSFSIYISEPCFEYWYVLHFGPCDKPFSSKQKRSVCDCCIEHLQPLIDKHVPKLGDYKKSSSKIYDSLKDRLHIAMKCAKLRREQCAGEKSSNPSTNVDELVRELFDLAGRQVPGEENDISEQHAAEIERHR